MWKESLTWLGVGCLRIEGRNQTGATAIADDTITCSLVRCCGIGSFGMSQTCRHQRDTRYMSDIRQYTADDTLHQAMNEVTEHTKLTWS
jgi:hypothetical protein